MPSGQRCVMTPTPQSQAELSPPVHSTRKLLAIFVLKVMVCSRILSTYFSRTPPSRSRRLVTPLLEATLKRSVS